MGLVGAVIATGIVVILGVLVLKPRPRSELRIRRGKQEDPED